MRNIANGLVCNTISAFVGDTQVLSSPCFDKAVADPEKTEEKIKGDYITIKTGLNFLLGSSNSKYDDDKAAVAFQI